MLCLTVESSFFSALQTSQVHLNSIYAQPKQEPILLQARRRKLSSKKKSLLHLCRVYQVNVFYPKTMNKQQDKNGRETFRDQIYLNTKDCKFSVQMWKTNEFLACTRSRSRCLNRCLLEFTARNLRRFVSKFLKNSEIVRFKIKIFYWTILLGNINT